jgi:hypothetical protein
VAYAVLADVQGNLPQFPMTEATKPKASEVTAKGIPDSEAEFDGRVRALGFSTPLTNVAALAWAKFVVGLMGAAWALEVRTAAVGGEPAFQSARYFRDRVEEQFRLLADGKIVFDPELDDDIVTPGGFIRGGPLGTEPRATMDQKF